jgi:hypothetical protein
MGGACSTYWGEERCIQDLDGETLSETDYLGVDGNLILRWIVRKWDVGTWTGSVWFWIGAGGRKCGNEPSGSIKCG